MNALTKNWLEALRSGEYKQGMFALRSGDTFCCLGVLADIRKKQKKAWRHEDKGKDDAYVSTRLISEYNQCDLMELNDETGLTFKEIADYIEKEGIIASPN